MEKFAHHPAIKRIQRHRHVPRHVYNSRNELRSGRIAARRKYDSFIFFFHLLSFINNICFNRNFILNFKGTSMSALTRNGHNPLFPRNPNLSCRSSNECLLVFRVSTNNAVHFGYRILNGLRKWSSCLNGFSSRVYNLHNSSKTGLSRYICLMGRTRIVSNDNTRERVRKTNFFGFFHFLCL